MAQQPKKPVELQLPLPLRFEAAIDGIAETVCVGEWIVGYHRTAKGKGEWAPPKDLVFPSGDLADLLTSWLNFANESAGEAEPARRFLVRNGTFRRWDWRSVEEVLASALPDEVKEEVRRSGLLDTAVVYLLRVEDFWREWSLLRSLSLLAGKLNEGGSPLLWKLHLDEARKYLFELRKYFYLPTSQDETRRLASLDISQLDAYDVSDKVFKRALTEGVRLKATDLLRIVFERALGTPTASPAFDLESGAGFWLKVESVLGVAYLGLLMNFSRGWRRCRRPDCGNTFRVTDDPRKIFCSQYCGHLESLRRKRKEEKLLRKLKKVPRR